jgi:drug/metabolite transporter (DMT)-like permease
MSSPTSISPIKGIACVVGGGALLALNSTVAKFLVADYPAGQIMVVRALFVFVLVAVLVWRDGGMRTLRIRSPIGQLSRALCLATTTFLMILSVERLPLGDVFAINHAAPLIMTALAVIFLGERVGWRRWLAITTGFIGVLIMLRPTAAAFQIAALLPLTVAFFSAVRDVITRRISATDSSTATFTVTTTVILLAGLGLCLFSGWVPIRPEHLWLFALAALFQGLAHFLTIEAFRLAEAKVVAPFKYATILWAMAIGYVFWGDVPDVWIIAGGTIVVASGLYILHRQRRERAKSAVQAAVA